MGFSEETVQSNVRNTWYIREKENTWICVALYCSSIRTTISPPPFGGRDTKGEHTLARPVLVLSVWVTVPTAGRVFSFFQCQSCCCALRCLHAVGPGAAPSLTHNSHVPGQAPPAKARPALPSAPAPMCRGSNKLRCSLGTSKLEA